MKVAAAASDILFDDISLSVTTKGDTFEIKDLKNNLQHRLNMRTQSVNTILTDLETDAESLRNDLRDIDKSVVISFSRDAAYS